ncbi:hypothetical protein AB834_02955 [PVC group bacterium (ex Bugula neritina AB1)]|nr:hypothetical protein AB834_02955 [PVC group bacterium (ex Bugula neritina AB1)]
MSNIIYKISCFFVYIFCKIFCPLRVSGLENIRDMESCIIASNHASFLDPPLIGLSLFPKRISYLARDTLFKNIFFSKLIRTLYAYPIRVKSSSPRDIKNIVEIVNLKRPTLIFLEGTRTFSGDFLPPKRSLGFIAIKAGKPIVPIYIEGTFEAYSRHKRWVKRHPVKIKIGAPLHIEDLVDEGVKISENAQKVVDKVMTEIKSLKEKSSKEEA